VVDRWGDTLCRSDNLSRSGSFGFGWRGQVCFFLFVLFRDGSCGHFLKMGIR
jgi:hypothetical protein